MNEVFVSYVAMRRFSISGKPDQIYFGITVFDENEEVLLLNWEKFDEMKEAVNSENIGDIIYDHPAMFEKFWGSIVDTGRVFWTDWPDGDYQEIPIDVSQIEKKWWKKKQEILKGSSDA